MTVQSEKNQQIAPGYFKYWGKARQYDDTGEPYHLLVFHCLDVAAVGIEFFRHHPTHTNRLASLLEIDSDDFLNWFKWFLAIHDLGKFSESFQNLRPDLLLDLQSKESQRAYPKRHDTLGYQLWLNSAHKGLVEQGWFNNSEASAWGRNSLDYPEDYWMMAVTGHHGLPPQADESASIIHDCFVPEDHQAALDFSTELAELFIGSQNGKTFPSLDAARMASWWLAGVSVMCDWVGSNRDYFPYQSRPVELDVYWEKALSNAQKAVSELGLTDSRTVAGLSLQQLFPPIRQPTPLQEYCSDAPLSGGPHLFILEDVTGSGKTEAAVMLAHRMLARGDAYGLYFALPTMATSSAMYQRLRDVYQRLYSPESKPSLVLAHGARELSSTFRQSIFTVTSSEEDAYGDTTTPAGAYCNAWIADNRKKALLAEIGVGTIDQALLGILPSRHQSLRLWGLLDKVLIVDEVHACDAYMHKLLCTLLQAQARAGGSVILLSATLPASQRHELLRTFQQGAGWDTTLSSENSERYPLATQLDSRGLITQQLETRDSVKRYVKVRLVDSAEVVINVIADAVADGKCVCWLRNTVADAREAYQQLMLLRPDWDIDLFHARFAMTDRQKVEQRVIENFGPKSNSAQRRGKILIATQVVEQSLDLDFDLMITDLAPVDLIIQRAGRLCRHRRDVQGNGVEANDQRGTPLLVLHGPLPLEDVAEDWFSHDFPGAAMIYDNHAQLWLTAKLLQSNGGFSMPEDARPLIEAVYGESADQSVPESLWENRRKAEGSAMGKRGIATMNALKLDSGYTGTGDNRWWEEDVTPTRLGEPSSQIYLARWDGRTMTPWAMDQDNAWSQSTVSIRKALITESELPPGLDQEAFKTFKEQLPGKGRWGVLVPLWEDNGQWLGEVQDEKGRRQPLRYDTKLGLLVGERECGK